MRALRIFGKVVAWTALSAALLVLATLLTAVIAGRTDWGRRRILALALPALQERLAGHLAIGAVDGDLTHELVLRDVALDDAEHQPAVRIKTLTVRYHLLALLRHTIDVTEVKAEQAWVHARRLADGRLNLAALARPSKPGPPLAYQIRLQAVRAELEARYDPPPPRSGPATSVHGTVHLAGHAVIDGSRIDAGIDELVAATSSPLRASLTAHGGVTVDEGAVAAHALELTLATDGAELRRLVPGVELRGSWSVTLRASGPADRLALSAVARPPAGSLTLDGTIATTARPPVWSATLHGRGLDPAPAVTDAPRGELRLDARVHGAGANGMLDLERLAASVAGTRIDAHGTAESGGDAHFWARVASPDLSRLRALGVRGLAGRLSAQGGVERDRTHLRVEAEVRARALRVGPAHIDRLQARVRDHDFIGEAHVTATGVRAADVQLDRLVLEASGNRKAVRATLHARGPRRTRAELALHGTPTLAGGRGVRIIGADMIIEKLALAQAGQAWKTAGPATLRVHHGLELRGLELASGSQRLGLDARWDAPSGVLAAELRTRKLNLRQLARLARPSLDLPDTELAIDARVRGTRRRPALALTVDGLSQRSQRLGLSRIHYALTARYAGERVAASWRLSSSDQTFQGKVDLPTVMTGNRPIMAELSASNLWLAQLRRLLPPAIANLDGRLDGSLRASGTTQQPVLALDLHGRKWQLGTDDENNDVHVAIGYKERQLDLRAEVHLQQSMGKDAGALTAQLALPIDLSLARLPSGKRLAAELEHKTPVAAVIHLTRLDVAKLPFHQLGEKPPLTGGMVDASLRLRGTLDQPILDLDVEGHQLQRGKLDQVELFASLDYAANKAALKLDASLRGAPLVRLRAETPLDLQRVLDRQPYGDTPLQVDAVVPGFDLTRVQDLLPQLEGELNATAALRGTLAAPTGKLDLAIAALRLGEVKYAKLEAHGAFDGKQLVARLEAREVKGGALTAEATLPLDAAQPLAARLRARGFAIDFQSENLTNPRLVKGVLDASLDLHGPRANPSVQGFFELRQGQLALATEARVYQDIAVDVAIADGVATLKRAQATIQDGSVSVSGQAKLAGLLPQSIDLRALAHKFPIPTGRFGAWLDATVTVHGQRTPSGLSGTVVVDKGTANLPKLAGGKKLQPTGPLEDVKFVDAAARRAQARRAAAEKEPATAELVAKIPGPFHVRSKELSTDLAGELQIAIVGPVARLSGHVHAEGGWFELLGRRYKIERARVAFGGESEPNPELDVRLTRELSATRLIIQVHGTAKKPSLVLTSDPPIYDQSQVIAAILSGDPAAQRVDDRSLDRKVTGVISSLLVNRIKDQIAPNLPIDVIKVDTGTEGSTGLGDTRVEIGKYLTDSIYVSYVHQFGSTFVGTQRFNANEANLEWRFARRFELETGFGDAAVGRLNLFWTVRY